MLPIVHKIMQHVGDRNLHVVSDAEIAEAERRLGFQLPELLRELYTCVGDGGFGPGYGFLGLIKPVPIGDFTGESVVELSRFSEPATRKIPVGLGGSDCFPLLIGVAPFVLALTVRRQHYKFFAMNRMFPVFQNRRALSSG